MRSKYAVKTTRQSSQTSQWIRLVLGGGIQAYRIAVGLQRKPPAVLFGRAGR